MVITVRRAVTSETRGPPDQNFVSVRRWRLFLSVLRLKVGVSPLPAPGIALGRKNYLFMGSESGGKSAAIAYTLIKTAKLNGVDPQAWLTDVLGRISEHKITKLDELMPWRYAEASA